MGDLRSVLPFRCNEIERGRLHKEWEAWKTSLECYFESEDIIDQKKKRAKLLHFGGTQLQALFQTLPDSEKFSYVTPDIRYYDVAILALDDFFKPVQQDVLERHRLRHMKQNQGERFAEFVIRVRQQIKECGVDKYPIKFRKILSDIMLTDAIVEGCISNELRRHILQKDRTVEEIEEIGKSLEGVEQQVKNFRHSEEPKADVFNIRNDRRSNSATGAIKASTNRNVNHPLVVKTGEINCFKCGYRGHISTDPTCPARGKTCKKCKRVGHFESQCRSWKRTNAANSELRSGTKKVRTVEHFTAMGDVESVELTREQTPDEDRANKDKKIYYALYAGNKTNVVTCEIGGINIDLLVDSGAEANLITEKAWNILKTRGVEVKFSEKGSDRILRGYASERPMTILGRFIAVVAVGSNQEEAEFFVVKGGERSLLGDTTAKRLGVLWIGTHVNHVISKASSLSKVKGVQVHIHMDPKAKPVFQPVRRLPVSLESAVERKLKELLDRDVIEEMRGPASWVSPLVVVGKANGEPRICLDLRRVNESVQRERHPMPLIDDFIARVGKDMMRSKLDIMDSFLQLELDEESRNVMTFITSRGMFRFKRMPFGLVTAPETFQKIMDSILAGCEGTWWYIDDIYVEGRNKKEHDARLRIVLEKLEELWWPKIDRAIEGFVKKCRGCTLVSVPDAPEPMMRKCLPTGPWEDIAIDFLGPLPEGPWLLVVVDYYSRFIEVVEMTRITAHDTIGELATIFERFGIPRTLRADNGPQVSSECEEFHKFGHKRMAKLNAKIAQFLKDFGLQVN
ncbi:uncharacterized protein K02A2.6-like [Toxorhynchites rutilus septentrionalis]|uniref:uncharacterized protein K02A2.6-like n=1 Tax=Toxorhynchites rutilus septentrionalis TaxID=329112 RepID=UPI00247A544F|nr:uncharacterized protein K02A2.6-like [Toxorhynchites rutilus septentrionalis]